MFGLDCEMCLTTSGNLELTRISIVDEDMNVSTVLYSLCLDNKSMQIDLITGYLRQLSET